MSRVLRSALLVGGVVVSAACSRTADSGATPEAGRGPAPAEVSTGEQPRPPKDAWAFVQALAALQRSGPVKPVDGVEAVAAALVHPTPRAVLEAVSKRVLLVPYAGSLVDSRSVRKGARLNTLDRALFLRAVLEATDHPARVVHAGAGDGVAVSYPASAGAGPIAVPEALRASLAKSVDDLLPPLWEAVQRQASQWASGAGVGAEREIYWVQVQENGNWSNLLFDDTRVSDAGAARARELADEELDGLRWSVGIRARVRRGQTWADVLSYESPAAALHARPVTYFHRPEGSLEALTPVLLVGDRVIEGETIDDGKDAAPIDEVALQVDVAGPGQRRRFTRRLVGPRVEGMTDEERALQLAPVARLTVTTTHLSPLDHAAIVEGAFAEVARAVFQGGDAKDAPPLDLASLRAVALAGAGEEIEGTVGQGQGVLVFRGRPAVILDRETLAEAGETLYRVESMDLLDPGTSVYGGTAGAEQVGRAALASAIVDARLEDWLATGKDVSTSFEIVARALRDGAEFAASPPSGMEGADDFGDGRPAFVTVAGGSGSTAGVRLAGGPEAVFVLDDGTGGARSERPIDRVRSLCEKHQWDVLLLPMQVMPYPWLAAGIVGYQCRLAESYNTAASVIGNLMDPQQGGGDDQRIEELQRQIEGLGPGLTADLASGMAVNGVLHGMVSPLAERFANDMIAPVLSYFNEAGARLIPRVAEGGSRVVEEEAGETAISSAVEEAAEASARLRAEGVAAEEARKALRRQTQAAVEEYLKRAGAGEAPEVELLEGGSAKEAKAGAELDKDLARWYQREGRNYDPIHQTRLANLQEMRSQGPQGVLRNDIIGNEARGGTAANFSMGGDNELTTIRQGGVAIRINPESTTVDTDVIEGAGRVARYWRDGIKNGTYVTDIPLRELQYFNPRVKNPDGSLGAWLPIVPSE